jgi:hypothetical protein
MALLKRAARLPFAAAFGAFGVEYLLAAAGRTPTPGAPWPPLWTVWACVAAALFLASALSIAANRSSRGVNTLFGAVLLVDLLVEFLPALIRNVHNPDPWTNASEVAAMAGAALALGGRLYDLDWLRRLGEVLFALALIVFGVQHFLYAGYVASLIPVWIPAHAFVAKFTGGAMIAASLAIGSRIQEQLAAALTGAMFLFWFFALHLPRAIQTPHSEAEWTNAFVCLAVGGGALILAEVSRAT